MNPTPSTSTASSTSALVTPPVSSSLLTPVSEELAPLELNFKRILVPVDFSPHARLALAHALAIARQFNSEVTLVNVLEQFFYPVDWSYLPMPLADFISERQDESTAALQKLLDEAKIKGSIVVRTGRAWDEIVKTARNLRTDLIVIGTHGYTGFRHVLLGSVAEKVVQHAPCAVLTIRPDERDLK